LDLNDTWLCKTKLIDFKFVIIFNLERIENVSVRNNGTLQIKKYNNFEWQLEDSSNLFHNRRILIVRMQP